MATSGLRRVWPFARPHWRGLVFSFVAALATMGAGLTVAPITGTVIDDLRANKRGTVWPLAGLLLVIGLVEAVMAFLRRFSAARSAVGMEQDMRNAFYDHLQRLPVSFHDGQQSGQLLSRVMSDIATIRRFIGFGFVFLLVNSIQFVVILLLMLRLNVGLALLTGVLGVPVALLSVRFNRAYRGIARKVQDDQGDLTTVIEESATGIRIIKAFGRGAFMASRFRAQADILHDSNMGATRLRAFFWTVLHLLPGMNLALVLLFGGFAVIGNHLTIGQLATFTLYLRMLGWPIRSVGWILTMGEEARTGADRIFEVLDSVPTIVDRPGATTLDSCDGWIRFDRVSFRYPGSEKDVLRDVNLEIAPGETLAIVGMTGSGKTTLASLVPRLYDVTAGRVLLDGVDVRDITVPSLRRHMGVAFEDPVLFSMSVRENLALGTPDATEDDMRRALETANAAFVYELPWGLDTRVGEQGHTLSGGQRQRLALARAVLARPQVLVLDDPLSAVDVHTEALIEAALAKLLHGVTALLVVHRPSTLALADRVALLHDGTIVATGTHHDLMETVPLYRNILSQHADEPAEEVLS